MSYLLNAASSFTDDMVEGFVAAHADVVRRIDGGVARAAGTPPGQVALVIGGGSGHYPAFAGLVGTGLAHAAAMGNVFASPSAQQIYAVARCVAGDAGVLFSYGNYAGDVLNFDLAQKRLNAEGIRTCSVAVTDDISSAPPHESTRRRGVAGDLAVFRAAAWAAEQGRSLDEVWELAGRCNSRTRTLGVAFSGCTLPGAAAPLFRIQSGSMAVGMGIHGEPGLQERPLASAEEIAELLTRQLLSEQPPDLAPDARVAVIVNGLGSVKSEELYILFRGVHARLRSAGLLVVQPEVGEFATSFEMAGVSLTLIWLDDELERAWTGPCAAPGYRRGTVLPGTASTAPVLAAAPAPAVAQPGTPESVAVAATVVDALRRVRDVLDQHVEELGQLDAVAGDGDHGIGMQRGATAAVAGAQAAFSRGAGAASTLNAAADAWSDRAGGTSGALWGVALAAMATALGDAARPSLVDIANGAQAAAQAITRVGAAELGDKTMLDAMWPFARGMEQEVSAGKGLSQVWSEAARAATLAAEATSQLEPRAGRARAHAGKGVGHRDPGAVSFALAMTAVSGVLKERKTRHE